MFIHTIQWICIAIALLALLLAVGAFVMAYKLRSQTPEGLKRDVRMMQISVAEMQDEHHRMVKLLQRVNAREQMRGKRAEEPAPTSEVPTGDWKRETRKAMGLRAASGKHPVIGS